MYIYILNKSSLQVNVNLQKKKQAVDVLKQYLKKKELNAKQLFQQTYF